MPTTQVGQQPVQIVHAGDPAGVIYNRDSSTQARVGTVQEEATRTDGSILDPNGSMAVDGTMDIWVVSGGSGSITIDYIKGALTFFRPASLSGLGGVKVFVQNTTPTQPPTIPINSIWLKTSGGNVIGFFTWNGAAWVQQPFDASGVIAVGTIIANLIAAGTIVAGIVNGTEIDGGILRATNSFGATIMTINKSAATWFLYADTGSAVQGNLIASAAPAAGTDEFGKGFGAGVKAYGTGGSTSFVQMLPGNPAQVSLSTGDAAELEVGSAGTILTGSGGTKVFTTRIKAPRMTGFSNAQARVDCSSISNDGTTTPPEVAITATDGTDSTDIFMHPTSSSNGNFQFTNSSGGFAAFSRNMAGSFPVTKPDNTAVTVTQAVATDLTHAYSITGGDAQTDTVYTIKAGGFGVQGSTQQNLTVSVSVFGVTLASRTLLGTTIPANGTFHWEFECIISVLTTGVTGTVTATSRFTWSQTGTNTNKETDSGGNTNTTGTTVDTTANTHLSMQAAWASTTGAPTITSVRSEFTRTGWL